MDKKQKEKEKKPYLQLFDLPSEATVLPFNGTYLNKKQWAIGFNQKNLPRLQKLKKFF